MRNINNVPFNVPFSSAIGGLILVAFIAFGLGLIVGHDVGELILVNDIANGRAVVIPHAVTNHTVKVTGELKYPMY